MRTVCRCLLLLLLAVPLTVAAYDLGAPTHEVRGAIGRLLLFNKPGWCVQGNAALHAFPGGSIMRACWRRVSDNVRLIEWEDGDRLMVPEHLVQPLTDHMM